MDVGTERSREPVDECRNRSPFSRIWYVAHDVSDMYLITWSDAISGSCDEASQFGRVPARVIVFYKLSLDAAVWIFLYLREIRPHVLYPCSRVTAKAIESQIPLETIFSLFLRCVPAFTPVSLQLFFQLSISTVYSLLSFGIPLTRDD